MFPCSHHYPDRTGVERFSHRPEMEHLEDRTVPSIGSPFPIASLDDLEGLAVASSPGGLSVAVWATSDSATSSDVVAQLYDNATHDPVGSTIPVAATANEEHSPSVAMDAQGNFVVAWTSEDSSGNETVQFGLFSNAGTLTASGTVAGSDTLDAHDAQVAMSAGGKFVVAYEVDSGSGDVLATRYSPAGGNRGTINVGARTDFEELNPRVDMNYSGDFAVSYVRDNPADPTLGHQLMLKSYTDTGERVTTATIFVTDAAVSLDNAVGMDNKGNCTVVYIPEASGGLDMRRVTATGAIRDVMVLDAASSTSVWSDPHIAVNRLRGDFVVSYGRDDHGIVREFSNAGVLLPNGDHDLGGGGTGTAVGITAIDTYFVVHGSFDSGTSKWDLTGNFGAFPPVVGAFGGVITDSTMGMTVTFPGRGAKIVDLVFGGPAYSAGLEVGDLIVRAKKPGHDWHYVNTPGRYQKHVQNVFPDIKLKVHRTDKAPFVVLVHKI